MMLMAITAFALALVVFADILHDEMQDAEHYRDIWISIRNSIYHTRCRIMNDILDCRWEDRLMLYLGFSDPTWPNPKYKCKWDV